MAAAPLNAPPGWTNQDITLFHGTTLLHATAIQSGGVNPALGRKRTDFGPGFYTTTSYQQACSWASVLAASASATAAVVTITCARDKLAGLDTLAFIRGDYGADDFWSFVWHCRNGAADHGRGTTNAGFYDIVYGPVAAFWAQRSAMHDADQISFHTSTAAGAIVVSDVTQLP
jgi:hypothetical protein